MERSFVILDALFSSGILFNADIAFDSRKVKINAPSIQSKISCSLRRRRSSVLTDDKNARRKKKWEIIVRLPVEAPEESQIPGKVLFFLVHCRFNCKRQTVKRFSHEERLNGLNYLSRKLASLGAVYMEGGRS